MGSIADSGRDVGWKVIFWRPGPSTGRLRRLSDATAGPRATGLTSGFEMGPGVARSLWPGRAVVAEGKSVDKFFASADWGVA